MRLSVTPPAEKFIKRVLRFDGDPGGGLRLRVTAGGCPGPAAEFSVENAPKAGDAVIEISGIKLFLPAESRLLLDGPSTSPRRLRNRASCSTIRTKKRAAAAQAR